MVKNLNYVLLLLLTNTSLSYSQTINSKINGKIFSKGEAIKDVNILLITAKDSILVRSIVCNADGTYELTGIKPNTYLLSFQKLNYQTVFSESIKIEQEKLVYKVPPVELSKRIRYLKEVVVYAKIPYLEKRGGKTIIHVEQSVFGLGSSGYEILQTIPGVRIDQVDQLSISGKNNVAVYIDGKPSNLRGGDLIEFLKNTPTNNIEEIELLNAASAKYDAADNGGIINIKFKKGKNIGTNGNISFGSGIGRNYRYNTGLNFNTRTAKSNVYLNYDYSRIKAIDDNYLLRNANNSPINTLFNITNHDLKTRTNQNILFGFDYMLSKKHSFGLLANVFSNKMISDEKNESLIFNNTVKDSTILSTSMENRRVNNISTNLNYTGIIGEKGSKVSADVDFLNYDRQSNEQILSTYLNRANNTFKPPLIFENLTPAQISILTSKVDFSLPIRKNTSLEAGVKTSWVNTLSDRKIDIKSGQNYIFNPSTRFKYQENIFAGYLSFKTKTDKSNLELGLRAENTIAKGDTSSRNQLINRNYLNLFPNLVYDFALNTTHKISFSYNKGITRPRYEELNPFFYFLDQYTYNQGNPTLLPSYTHGSKINWEFKTKYNFSVHYNYVKDFVYTIYEQNNLSNTAITSRQNYKYRQTIGLDMNIPITIAKWWNLDINTESNYEFFSYINQQKKEVFNNSTSFLVDFNHALTLPKKFNAMVNMHYESPTSYGIFKFEPLYYVNIGISKSILNKQGSIKLVATDLFDTNSNRYATNVYNLDLRAKEKTETRSFRIGFNYKFGKKEVKPFKQRKPGADEEKLRVGQ